MTTVPSQPFVAAPALVVFSGGASLRWLRILRRGFRHCFVAVLSGDCWIFCDPLSHRTDLAAVAGLGVDDLADWYRSLGLTVVVTRTRPTALRLAPIRPFTCVEAVKRVLGIRAPRVFTPWQLFCWLNENPAERGIDCPGS